MSILRYMNKSALAVLLVAFGLTLAFASHATASIVEALELPQLVRASDVILVGRVVDQNAHWDDRRRIVTDVTLRVEDALKGSRASGEEVTVRRFGGSIGDLGMKVPGEPTFEMGERRLLFGQRGTHGLLRPVGMAQGALAIRTRDGRETVLPSEHGAALVRHTRQGGLVPAPGALLHPRPLDEVLSDIRALLEGSDDAPEPPLYDPGTGQPGSTRPR